MFLRMSHWHKGLVAAPGLIVFFLGVILGLSAAPGSAFAEAGRIHKVRLGPSCQLIPIESVDFQRGRRSGWTLYIGGMRPYINMDVELRHQLGRRGALTVRVVGCLNAIIGLPLQSPYNVDLPMTTFPRVRRVKIIGSNGFVRRRVPRR